VRLTRISANERKAFNIYKNIFYTLLPYGYALSIAENLITGNIYGINEDILGLALPKADYFSNSPLGRATAAYFGPAFGILSPIYGVATELISKENNRERLERLVFQHFTNQFGCYGVLGAEKRLLDCDKKICSECNNLAFMRGYANLIYSLFDKTYILNSEADYQAAEAGIKKRRAVIDQMVRFYVSRL